MIVLNVISGMDILGISAGVGTSTGVVSYALMKYRLKQLEIKQRDDNESSIKRIEDVNKKINSHITSHTDLAIETSKINVLDRRLESLENKNSYLEKEFAGFKSDLKHIMRAIDEINNKI